jgi:hypothetical protein
VTKLAVREEFELDEDDDDVVDQSTKSKNVECVMSNVDDNEEEEAGPTVSDIVDGMLFISSLLILL